VRTSRIEAKWGGGSEGGKSFYLGERKGPYSKSRKEGREGASALGEGSSKRGKKHREGGEVDYLKKNKPRLFRGGGRLERQVQSNESKIRWRKFTRNTEKV